MQRYVHVNVHVHVHVHAHVHVYVYVNGYVICLWICSWIVHVCVLVVVHVHIHRSYLCHLHGCVPVRVGDCLGVCEYERVLVCVCVWYACLCMYV